jgi:mycothiol synthase|tara:strand:+ start:2757 stop:3455 length:699 start_codon:yes stop_codon:yes gene_type:complete
VNEESKIIVGTDRDGTTIEVDAEQWTKGALADALTKILDQHNGKISLWIDNPTPATDSDLQQLKFTFQRDLFRMDCELPLEQTTDIETRSFRPGQDEEEWCTINNKAFSWHREQSGWTVEMVLERQLESWFDPEGFRIYETDDKLAAYCWTKIHKNEKPHIGEVYVIAVDPKHHGKGLGRALTLAGYQHLHSTGITKGTLYVDAENIAAVTLYKDIGLTVGLVRRLYTNQIS